MNQIRNDVPAVRSAPLAMQPTQGPLVRQTKRAADLALILNHAAMELWDACTLDDSPQMWEEARAIASRILATCPVE